MVCETINGTLEDVVVLEILTRDFAALEILLPDVADLSSAAPISEAKYKNSGFNGPR